MNVWNLLVMNNVYMRFTYQKNEETDTYEDATGY